MTESNASPGADKRRRIGRRLALACAAVCAVSCAGPAVAAGNTADAPVRSAGYSAPPVPFHGIGRSWFLEGGVGVWNGAERVNAGGSGGLGVELPVGNLALVPRLEGDGTNEDRRRGWMARAELGARASWQVERHVTWLEFDPGASHYRSTQLVGSPAGSLARRLEFGAPCFAATTGTRTDPDQHRGYLVELQWLRVLHEQAPSAFSIRAGVVF
jgi:hypothetical protein